MDHAREQLAEQMNERRRELRLKWTEVARRARMSPQNLLRIRTGEISVTNDAADGLDHALQWQLDSVHSILAGGKPTPLDVPRPTRRQRPPLDPLTSTPEEIAEFLEEVRQAQGDEVFFELFQATLKVNMQAREGRERTERRPHDRTDAGTTASDNN
jgi:transcriptional regulator with XRE-family HTH domain